MIVKIIACCDNKNHFLVANIFQDMRMKNYSFFDQLTMLKEVYINQPDFTKKHFLDNLKELWMDPDFPPGYNDAFIKLFRELERETKLI